MCGFCGIASLDLRQDVDPSPLAAMTRVLAHRGPDDEQMLVDGPVALGHRRLAVIDPSAAGRQPMHSDDGAVTIVYNGEIYDHATHRPWLESRGHRFRSSTDTEVLLKLYEELGDECIHRLRGMFAFAIWDRRRRRVLLARDRLGQKPLYYWRGGTLLVFASELKSLLEHSAVPRAVDLEAVHDYLSFDYVPAPRTAFAEVRKLQAAHSLVLENGAVRTARYWSLSFAPRERDLDEGGIREELLARLRESVRLHLMSDVPLGVLLSGGIDSAAIVALMSDVSGRPIRTFTLGLEDPELDERPRARLVAERFETEHHEFLFRPCLVDLLPELVRHFDEPFADPSALPTHFIATQARRVVTVALTGDGGDECFAGYDRYVKLALARPWLRSPEAVKALLRGASSALVADDAPGQRLDARLRDFFALAARTPAELFCQWTLHFDLQVKRRLYSPELWSRVGHLDSRQPIFDIFRRSAAADAVGKALEADTSTYLPDDLQVKTDRATMACSLEARSPFLDHELAGFAASLPTRFKLRGVRRKWILRRALRPLLQREVLEGPKRGFGLPVHDWLRGELRELAVDTLTSARARRGYFEPAGVRQLLDDHIAGRCNRGYELWNLLVLELWHRELVDGSSSPRPSLS